MLLEQLSEFLREPLRQPGVVRQGREIELNFHSCCLKSDVSPIKRTPRVGGVLHALLSGILEIRFSIHPAQGSTAA